MFPCIYYLKDAKDLQRYICIIPIYHTCLVVHILNRTSSCCIWTRIHTLLQNTFSTCEFILIEQHILLPFLFKNTRIFEAYFQRYKENALQKQICPCQIILLSLNIPILYTTLNINDIKY